MQLSQFPKVGVLLKVRILRCGEFDEAIGFLVPARPSQMQGQIADSDVYAFIVEVNVAFRRITSVQR